MLNHALLVAELRKDLKLVEETLSNFEKELKNNPFVLTSARFCMEFEFWQRQRGMINELLTRYQLELNMGASSPSRMVN